VLLLLFNLLAEFLRAAGLPGYREPATIHTQVLTRNSSGRLHGENRKYGCGQESTRGSNAFQARLLFAS
jgi:hypothetical protein